MLIQQLSVFLENKQGRLTEVTQILGQAGVNMSAFSIAENSDFGILRVIVSDPSKAYQALKDRLFAVSLTDVICLQCPNTPGSLAAALQLLSDNQIFIEYMYAFSMHDKANVIMKPDQINRAIEVLSASVYEVIRADQVIQ